MPDKPSPARLQLLCRRRDGAAEKPCAVPAENKGYASGFSARQILLFFTGNAQFSGGHVAGDDRSGPHKGLVTHTHRSHQGGITANKGAPAYLREMFVFSIIVAGDGSRADIAARTDLGIAKVTQMIGLGPLPQARLFQFHKISYMGLRLKNGSGAQPRVRPDQRAFTHFRPFKVRE